MLPFLAQGAAQAIEDAWSLGQALQDHADAEQALRAYETARRPRTARIQREARSNGMVYHLAGPAAFARDAVLRLTGSHLIDRYDWIYSA
jgi:salicylate hydroxylase